MLRSEAKSALPLRYPPPRESTRSAPASARSSARISRGSAPANALSGAPPPGTAAISASAAASTLRLIRAARPACSSPT